MNVKRLNGWRRMWVVVAGVMLLCAVGWSLNDAADQYRLDGKVLLGFGRPECREVQHKLQNARMLQNLTLAGIAWAVLMSLLYFCGAVVAWVRCEFSSSAK